MLGLGLALALAKSRGGGSPYGPELIGNPEFDNALYWTPGPGWVVSGNGKATGTVAAAYLYQGPALPAGRTYRVTYELANVTAGSLRAYLGATATFGAVRSTNGVFTDNITPISPNEAGVLGASFTGDVLSFSVKEVL